MAGPFYQRLKLHYESIGETLKAQAKSSAIFPNNPDSGSSREKAYLSFLRKQRPSSCNIIEGGFLFDLDGRESKQIDIIVTNHTSIRYRLPIEEATKEFACVEGALAVVSMKSTLNTPELFKALEEMASIPSTAPLKGRIPFFVNIPNYADWPYKIIYAHEGIALETLCKSLNKFYLDCPNIPFSRRPNLIHVNGIGCVVRIVPGGEKLRNGDTVPEHTFHQISDLTNVYALKRAIDNIQSNAVLSQYILLNYSEMIDKIDF